MRNFKKFFTSIPLDKHEHRAGRIVGGTAIVEFAVESVRIGGIGDHSRTIGSSAWREEKIGASHSRTRHQKCQGAACKN